MDRKVPRPESRGTKQQFKALLFCSTPPPHKCKTGTLDISDTFITSGKCKKGLSLNVNGGLVVRTGAALFRSQSYQLLSCP